MPESLINTELFQSYAAWFLFADDMEKTRGKDEMKQTVLAETEGSGKCLNYPG